MKRRDDIYGLEAGRHKRHPRNQKMGFIGGNPCLGAKTGETKQKKKSQGIDGLS